MRRVGFCLLWVCIIFNLFVDFWLICTELENRLEADTTLRWKCGIPNWKRVALSILRRHVIVFVIVFIVFLSRGTTVNSTYYKSLLERWWNGVRRNKNKDKMGHCLSFITTTPCGTPRSWKRKTFLHHFRHWEDHHRAAKGSSDRSLPKILPIMESTLG